jgi:hypothetical protein
VKQAPDCHKCRLPRRPQYDWSSQKTPNSATYQVRTRCTGHAGNSGTCTCCLHCASNVCPKGVGHLQCCLSIHRPAELRIHVSGIPSHRYHQDIRGHVSKQAG